MFRKVFKFYDKNLVKHPVITKCISAGVLYGTGDLVAQYGQYHVNKNENNTKQLKTRKMEIDYIRLGAFCLFGTLISGPLLHHFFKHLDKVPRYLKWDYKIRRYLGKYTNILYRKSVIDISQINKSKISISKFSLEKIRKWRLWTNLCIKAFSDVLLFDAGYIFIFYIFVGMFTGVGYKEYGRVNNNHDQELLVHTFTTLVNSNLIEKDNSHNSNPTNATDINTNPNPSTDNTNTLNPIVLKSIWNEEVVPHLGAVYIETYLMDCKVWIPIQLLNFRFIPLRFQVLFTNAASLLWNVYLSLMASSTIHTHEQDENCIQNESSGTSGSSRSSGCGSARDGD